METNPIQEANRYLANARQILSEKAGKEGNYYSNSKYVKLAGHAAWSGVLIALDAALQVKKTMKKGQRPDFQDYQAAIAKKDAKMTKPLLWAYESCRKVLGYDGNSVCKIVQGSLEAAKDVIDWASLHYNPETQATSTFPRRRSFLSTLKFW
jgi:hypothetical protein